MSAPPGRKNTNIGKKPFITHSRGHVNLTPTQCTNCGQVGHMLRNCPLPVTSYGIITVRSTPGSVISLHKLCSTRPSLTGMEHANEYEFLLIQRRDSLSFIEFIRGKYIVSDIDYITRLFRSMTKNEHIRLRTMSFDTLWKSVWGETSSAHRTDYENSEKKFKAFCTDDLAKFIQFMDDNSTKWDEPEWGFPKGRRNPYETDIHCAIREFQEETNLNRNQFTIIHNIQPLVETFFGSNSVHYCHKYYLAVCNSDIDVSLDIDNPHMVREIGDIRWFSLEDAILKIRPDSVEKREILLQMGRILKNFFPIQTEYIRRS